MPADHHIENFELLTAKLPEAIKLAEQGKLITFSITPNEPHTGYGYIKQGNAILGTGCYDVAQFKEKPNAQTAKRYLSQGGYSWNSGLFLFTPQAYLDELQRFAPKIADSVKAASQFTHDLGFTRPNCEQLKSCERLIAEH